MLYPRLIPSLLVNSKQELVKTIRFKEENYLGDPLNAAYIFSGFEADELLVLDIDASKNKKCICVKKEKTPNESLVSDSDNLLSTSPRREDTILVRNPFIG